MRIPQAFILILLFGAVASAQTRPAATEPPSVSVATIPKSASGEYVGAERCRSCHRAEFLEYGKTRHARLEAPKNSATGCEMCHGGGKAHADAEEAAQGDEAKTAAASKLIFSFQANPKQNAEKCLQCHSSGRDQGHFARSEHMNHGVACNRCHSMHLVDAARNPQAREVGTAQGNFFNVPKLAQEVRWLNESQLSKPQPELCYGCHLNIQAQFALPNHHRVPEGAMKCTDCHSVHGSENRFSMKQAGGGGGTVETCGQCHVDKRGPFAFEHAAVKVEGCTACHSPHGSINRMMLARREERFLCLQCHVAPVGVNVPHSRLSFQTRGDCTRCHVQIHGSNFDANFLN